MNANTTRICIRPGRRSRTLLVNALLALSISLGWGAQASAVPMNGSFEDGFSGWQSLGNTSIQGTFGSNPGGISPNHGDKQALLSNATEFDSDGQPVSGPATIDSIAKFLAGTDTTFEETIEDKIENFLDYHDAVEGSAIRTANTFTVAAGQVLTFSYNFLTLDPYYPDVYDPYDHNDFVFFTLNATSRRIADIVGSLPILSPSSAVLGNDGLDIYQTGYRQVSVKIKQDGTYRLGFGVVNVDSNGFASGLLLDKVSVDDVAVPEPSSVVLLLLGLVGLAWWRRSTVA